MKKRGGKKSLPRSKKTENKMQGALFGGKRPGGRDGSKKREKRLEGKQL